MQHEPSRLLSDADRTGDLAGANAILAITDHPKGAHPFVESQRRILENRTDFERELLLASLAEPHAAGADERMLLRAATGARNYAIRPAKVERILKAAVRIAEVNNRVLECVRRFYVVIMRLFAMCVKYIITLNGNCRLGGDSPATRKMSIILQPDGDLPRQSPSAVA